MKRLFSSIGILIIVVAVALLAFGPVAAKDQAVIGYGQSIRESKSEVFIVQLSGDPVVSYEGDVNGLPATKGIRNPHNGKVQRYIAYLNGRHDDVLHSVGADNNSKLYDYTYSFNGFAIALTPEQLTALSSSPDVLNIWADAARYPETDNTPDFLGLTAEGGLWDMGYDGEDIIVGVIDTGIWPEHPSFSDQADLSNAPGNSGKNNLAYGSPPSDWYGDCVSGEQFSQDDCNNKLIGARFYRLGAAAATVIPEDYLSPRDRDGHGTHTASTAAGNAGVQAEIFGIDRDTVSGIAPRARVAAYKVCWNDAGCYTSDIVAAIDDAVADGVDVINYSIGGGPSLLGPDDIAYLFAADAGVWVATSAGNSGPDAATVGGPATVPWITAVGASTHDRTFQGSVELGSGAEYFGASVTGGTDVLPLVNSEDASLDPGNPDADEDAELCIPGALDPGVVTGKIVLCLRGEIARVDKSLAVYQAGGAGMVLYNPNDEMALVTDNHWVPSVHINFTDGSAIKSYIDDGAGASATAQIHGGEAVSVPAPWMADFSSRGPNAVAGDIIKPDVTAPGVNVLAGNSPNPYLGAPGELFQSISGTSMASPHVAGIYALLKQAHPDWTPAMAKSAIMTTAYQNVMKEDGSTLADPFDMGGGHVDPNPAADPGLVYDAGFLDYLAFLCGSTSGVGQSTCDFLEANGFSFDASDLNLASIGIAELAGFQTISRTVTNVGPAGTYDVSVDAPPGIYVEVSPATLTLAEGESDTYSVYFETAGATLNQWVFGSLTWSHGSYDVRSPIAIKPVAIATEYEVSGEGETGSASFDVTFGYTGVYTAAAHGLEPAEITSDTVMQDPDQSFDKDDGYSNRYEFELSNAAFFRVAIPPDAVADPDAIDLDIYVYDPDGNLVGSSTNGGTDEQVDISLPEDGTWEVYVHGWYTAGASADFDMYNWTLSATPGGSLVVDSAPASATLGATETIEVSWTGATASQWYLGAVSHSDASDMIGLTVVNVDNR